MDSSIIKAKSDLREYRMINLKNGLQTLLVFDPDDEHMVFNLKTILSF